MGRNGETIAYRPIGVIHSEHTRAEDTPIQPVYAQECRGQVEIFPEYTDGLRDIEGFSHIYLLYHLHRAGSAKLVVKPFLHDVERGVFATRAPCRPNAIGLSIVELVRREGNVLHLKGVDVLDGTPLLDIKPYTARFDRIEGTRNGWQDEVDDATARKRGQRGYRPTGVSAEADHSRGAARNMPTLPLVREVKEATLTPGMTIAIASGKGGTGKTTVAVNLALTLGGPVRLLDCDVEEPNCHLFLRPKILNMETVGVPVPVVDTLACDACGRCAEICQFGAIAVLKNGPIVFAELCHGCGGCQLVCPRHAIREETRPIGAITVGQAGDVEMVTGQLRVGEAKSPPLIRAVKKYARDDRVNIVDCPPGTSCPVIAALRGADFVVLVTEPTPFGLHDLKLAVATVRHLGLACGVVINRSDIGDSRVKDYCVAESLPVLVEIPHRREIAEAYSRGQVLVQVLPEMRDLFADLGTRIMNWNKSPSRTAP
jgi:tRNA-Thr(GGU) m(6)t(6)A37 methyltransferase TsaA